MITNPAEEGQPDGSGGVQERQGVLAAAALEFEAGTTRARGGAGCGGGGIGFVLSGRRRFGAGPFFRFQDADEFRFEAADFSEKGLLVAVEAAEEFRALGVGEVDAGFEGGLLVEGGRGGQRFGFTQGLHLLREVLELDGADAFEAELGEGEMFDEAEGDGSGRTPGAGEVFAEGIVGLTFERLQGIDGTKEAMGAAV
jgi:hypothetical protein